MSEKVYAFIAWDDGDDEKVVFLCKTEELADKLQDNYIKHGEWDHTKVEAMNIYDSLLDAEGWLI